MHATQQYSICMRIYTHFYTWFFTFSTLPHSSHSENYTNRFTTLYHTDLTYYTNMYDCRDWNKPTVLQNKDTWKNTEVIFFSGNFTLGILNKIPMKALNIMFALQEGTKVQAVSKGWSRQATGDLWHFSMFTLESEDLGFFSYHNTTAASKLSFTSESGNYY